MAPRRHRACALALFLAGSALLTSPPAHAGVFDIFGFGARNVAMGGAATASADDHTATFYNPAGLATRKIIQLGATFSYFATNLNIDQAAAPAGTASDGGLTAHAPSDASGISLGVLFPLGGKIGNRVALGLGIYLPLAHALRMEALEPSVPRWARYNTLADKLHVLASVAAELTDWCALGVGMQSLAKLQGSVRADIDLTNDRITRRETNVEIFNTIAPVVGLLFTPARGWRVGVTYRGPVQLDYEVPFVFELGAAMDLDLLVRGTELYTPHTLAVGTSYHVEALGGTNMDLTAAFDATVAMWSLAPDPSMTVEVQATGEVIAGLGLVDYVTVLSGKLPTSSFRDALSLRLGAELGVLEWLLVRAGLSWQQSATREPVGPTSYLDSDAFGAAGGVAFTFPDPLEMNDRPIVFDLTGQITVHPSTRVERADPSDPIGWLEFGGQIYGVMASVRHAY